MPFRKISPDIKERSIFLVEEGMDEEEIAWVLGVSVRSMQRWRRNQRDFGTVIPPKNPLQSRPRKLTPLQTADLLLTVENSPYLYLDELLEYLAVQHDSTISRTRLHNVLKDSGLTYKLLRKAARERDPVARLNFRTLVHHNITANMIVAIDESSKDDRTIYRHYGRAPRGNRADSASDFVRGDRYSILPALTVNGYIACRVVPDSIDGLEFFDFIVNDVLPHLNAFPGPNSVVLMDNCSIHKSQAVIDVIESTGACVLFLPPYSPDFNPAENSFQTVKAWLRRHFKRCQARVDPIGDLYEACAQVTAEKARQWFHLCGYAVE